MDDTMLILTAIAVIVPLGVIVELIVDFIKNGSNSDEPNYFRFFGCSLKECVL